MIQFFQKWIGLGLLLFIPLIVNAAALPIWQIVPNESKLTFTGTQNGSPVSGEFKKFSGDIQFDPDHLKESHVKIIIDMNSVSASYAELAANLKTSDWFNVALYPNATFQANDFTKTGEKSYQAKGTLTIRDKTIPTTLQFTLEEYSATKARVKGSSTIKRNAFGVGQGDWTQTDQVKDEVVIDFTLTATKK